MNLLNNSELFKDLMYGLSYILYTEHFLYMYKKNP